MIHKRTQYWGWALAMVGFAAPLEVGARNFRVNMLPNGSAVSCAACHVNPSGGGTRTAFGRDVFDIVKGPSNTPFWSASLAAKDSDGDGFTNGQELGDPDGDGTPAAGASVTNPGSSSSFPVNQAPSVALTAPASGATLPPPGVTTVSATATDTDGSVARVEFFAGSSLLGTRTAAPFDLVIDLAPGAHELTARAVDNQGAATVSAPVLVNVDAPTPSTISGITVTPGGLTMQWTGGTGPFRLQTKASLAEPWVAFGPALTTHETTVTPSASVAFYRVADLAEVEEIALGVALSGAAERPDPVNSPGTGTGTLRLRGSTLTFDVQYSGLTTVATAAHIHGPASTSASAGPLINLAPFNGGTFGTSGTLSGSVVLTPEQKAALLSELTYINVHTSTHPAGEIRGQIVP